MKLSNFRFLAVLALVTGIGCGELVNEDLEITDAGEIDAGDQKNNLLAEVSIPIGTGAPGCEETDECYLPAVAVVGVGGVVHWSNDDTAAHTITHGTPEDGLMGEFDSGLLMAGAQMSHTFRRAGTFPYFCMVHPWMLGTVQVNE